MKIHYIALRMEDLKKKVLLIRGENLCSNFIWVEIIEGNYATLSMQDKRKVPR